MRKKERTGEAGAGSGRIRLRRFLFPAVVVLVLALSIWGPQTLSEYKDRTILGQIHEQEVLSEGEGYRYTLSSAEKLYLLSECLKNQTYPESEQSAAARQAAQGTEDLEYQEGAYVFIQNHRGPSGKEITGEEIFETCNEAVNRLKELGILPKEVRQVSAQDYDAVLYSAIDVLEPQNNVSVWKLSLSAGQSSRDPQDRLMDIYIDADDGRIYEFYVRYARSGCDWDALSPDALMESWSSYMGLPAPESYEEDNPLMETTPYYRKYAFPGMGEGRTVVTLGFYEGINELFLRIS